jgi:hypothetical protein
MIAPLRTRRRMRVPVPPALGDALRRWLHPRAAAGVEASFVRRGDGGATLLLWATPPAAEAATPIGTATFRWTDGGPATIEEIAWELTRDEGSLWRAIEALAGESLVQSPGCEGGDGAMPGASTRGAAPDRGAGVHRTRQRRGANGRGT